MFTTTDLRGAHAAPPRGTTRQKRHGADRVNENVLRLFTDGRMAIDVSSESVVEAFSFYVPKVGKVIRKNVSDLLILLLSAYFKFLSFIPFFFLFCEHL